LVPACTAWLVPVAETGINGLYKPGLKAFFPPVLLKVLPSQDRIAVFASETGLSIGELLCGDIPKADLAWTYKKGKRLVTREKESLLPTQMQ
jgi:hypothetical protein